uniref:EF-hand domain-containing protein n=1 Tax=Panagrolaimus sp. PS1159 TaxID=55785 RepID=A0AC35FBW8_9BILA
MTGLCNAECCWGYPSCNGIGSCNIFCCNCDYGCNNKLLSRSPTGSLKQSAEKIFNDVDKNKNGKIDFDEAVAYAVKNGKNESELEKDRSWFSSMDKNYDENITPNEFDGLLEN